MAADEFGRHARVEGALTLTTEELLYGTLTDNLPVGVKPLTTAMTGKITTARIRYAMSELAAMNIDNVQKWLEELGKQSPKAAIEAFIQLCEFSLPKLKAVAIDVRSGDGSVKTMSSADLERAVIEGN